MSAPPDLGLLKALLETLLPGGGYVAMLYKAYLDESYTDKGPPILGVGGYLVRADVALELDEKWKAVLAKYGVKEFHMVDVAHGAGEFAGMCVKKRIALETEMIGLIKEHVTFGAVVLANPLRLTPAFGHTPEDPYTQCLEECVLGITAVANTRDPGAKVAFFFDKGHGTERMADRILSPRFAHPALFHNRVASHTFANSADLPGLQAADLFVWQAVKWLKDLVTQERGMRGDFRSLVEMQKQHKLAFLASQPGMLGRASTYRPDLPDEKRDNEMRRIFTNPDNVTLSWKLIGHGAPWDNSGRVNRYEAVEASNMPKLDDEMLVPAQINPSVVPVFHATNFTVSSMGPEFLLTLGVHKLIVDPVTGMLSGQAKIDWMATFAMSYPIAKEMHAAFGKTLEILEKQINAALANAPKPNA